MHALSVPLKVLYVLTRVCAVALELQTLLLIANHYD